jgi:hypothetical protein
VTLEQFLNRFDDLVTAVERIAAALEQLARTWTVHR